ncbi:MAG: DinB family protein [Rhodothermales bacterium]|nr:DinB family protein [Rhodothermales bacterium]
MALTGQLEIYERNYLDAKEGARGLAGQMSSEQFNWKPDPDRWSVGECLYHVNVISEGYLPVLRSALQVAHRETSGPFRYGWLARKFIDAVTPGTKPVSTAGSMKPPPAVSSRSDLDRAETLQRFEEDMTAFAVLVRESEGVDLARIKVRSPFLWLLRLPVGAFLEALGLHTLRHLDQASRVTEQSGFPR